MTTLALQVDDYLNQFHYNGQKENQIILQLVLLQITENFFQFIIIFCYSYKDT